jgi:hypothetical protein
VANEYLVKGIKLFDCQTATIKLWVFDHFVEDVVLDSLWQFFNVFFLGLLLFGIGDSAFPEEGREQFGLVESP